MPDVTELGRKVKAKYPQYADLPDAEVGRRVKAKYPGAYDDFTDTPTAQAEEPPGFFGNIGIGLKRAGATIGEAATAITDFVQGARRGDVRPALDAGELAVRGVTSLIGDSVGGGEVAQFLSDPAALQAAQQRQETRRLTESPNKEAFQAIRKVQAEANRRASLDPSLTGKVTRRATEFGALAAPAVATAIGTGGSLPALATLATLQSAGQPENLALNVGLEVAPLPVGQAFKAGVGAVRRAFGKGAAQVIEAEALPAATAQVRQAVGEVPPAVGEAIPSPAPTPPRMTLRGGLPEEELPPLLGADLPSPLESVFAKLGTDDIDQVAEMIANANRRFNKTRTVPGGTKTPRTPEEIQSSFDDYKTLNQLTPDEQRALGQVLPARTVSPVVEDFAGTGSPSRDISDIPLSEPNAQVDANLRELEAFFGAAGRETQPTGGGIAERMAAMARTPTSPVSVTQLRGEFPGLTKQQFDDEMVRLSEAGEISLMRHDAPGQLSAAERDAMVKVGDDYFTAATIREAAPRARSATVTGPSVSAPLDALNVAVSDAAQTAPPSLGRRILDELAALYQLPRSIMSSGDISAPFRQGALLTVPPTQWGRAGRAAIRMFQSFRTSSFDRIKQEIASHADAPVADEAGLYLATKAGQGLGKSEEAFLSKYGGKIPIVKQSQQAYEAYLDSLRMDTFSKYKRVIDGQGLSPDQQQSAYKAAAQWVNFATGRGSLGQRFDRTMDAASFFIFSPRYVASRLNVLNPLYYAKNAATPGGRAVLKQQMGELFQYAAVVAGTMKLAQAAGADVGLDPDKSDFLKIRFGNWTYDPLAGLQQVMRVIYRTGADITAKARGQKGEGPDALDIGGTFLRTKLAPAPSFVVDMVKGKTVTGKPFEFRNAIIERTIPIQWGDFVEGYQAEGWAGIGKAAPGIAGIGVQHRIPDPVDAAIEKARPLFSELQRLNRKVADLKKKEGETDELFQQRVKQFSTNYTTYGLRLLEDPRFKTATDEVKAAALNALNERAKGITHRPLAFPELELDANVLIDSAENSLEPKRPK